MMIMIIIITTDKQNRYKELANEIYAMWKQNATELIPIAVSSTRVIPKSLPQRLKRHLAPIYIHTNAKSL